MALFRRLTRLEPCLTNLHSHYVRRVASTQATNQKPPQKHDKGVLESLIVEEARQNTEISTARKVIETSKDVSYLGVILVGFGITGILFWSVFSEFLKGDSPQRIFTKSLKKVKGDSRVKETLGEPITAHGESSGRGRRRHIANQAYVVDGENYIRVKYHLKGSQREATVHADLKETSKGKWEFRYIFVELDGYPYGTIIIEDNR